MRPAIALCFIAAAVAAAQRNPGKPKPGDAHVEEPPTLPPEAIRFTGRTRPEGSGWRVDTTKHPSRMGYTYYYHCGESTAVRFNSWVCSRLNRQILKTCSDGYLQPYADGYAPICAAYETTSVTVFASNRQSNIWELRTWGDACGWLGARCGDHWQNAMLFAIQGTEVRDKPEIAQKGLEIDLDKKGLGCVKVYSS